MTVHPRPRGEHSCAVDHAVPAFGSSPPARGTHRSLPSSGSPGRFIPARAGNTRESPGYRRPTSVHPRPRGEHQPCDDTSGGRFGSSPPARGTRCDSRTRLLQGRFIPARAGNTKRPARGPISTPVHPRPRGEHITATDGSDSLNGSSPPARGTQSASLDCVVAGRFIPARAGNTFRCRRRRARRPVHPRPRGEHDEPAHHYGSRAGSSPPARGTPDGFELQSFLGRFIPARAGNTSYSTPRAAAASVHPRPRGEHVVLHSPGRRGVGSSPPARGTRRGAGGQPAADRFIPARAGNTLPTRY